MHLRRNTLYAIQQAVSRSFHIARVFSAKFYILSLFFKIKTTTKTSGFMISLPLVHKNVINCPEVTKPSKFLAKVVILSTLRARELLKIKEYILKFTPVLKKWLYELQITENSLSQAPQFKMPLLLFSQLIRARWPKLKVPMSHDHLYDVTTRQSPTHYSFPAIFFLLFSFPSIYSCLFILHLWGSFVVMSLSCRVAFKIRYDGTARTLWTEEKLFFELIIFLCGRHIYLNQEVSPFQETGTSLWAINGYELQFPCERHLCSDWSF